MPCMCIIDAHCNFTHKCMSMILLTKGYVDSHYCCLLLSSEQTCQHMTLNMLQTVIGLDVTSASNDLTLEPEGAVCFMTWPMQSRHP